MRIGPTDASPSGDLNSVDAVVTAVLALFVDWLAGVIEDVLRPKGL
jgi:hypothetical protein